MYHRVLVISLCVPWGRKGWKSLLSGIFAFILFSFNEESGLAGVYHGKPAYPGYIFALPDSLAAKGEQVTQA